MRDGIQIWNCESWDDVKLLRTLPGNKLSSLALIFAPHGDPMTLFSYDSDGKMRLWDVPSGQQRGVIVLLENGGWVAATAEGDYRASDGSDDGPTPLFRFQTMDEKKATHDYNPKDFIKKFRPNDPDKPLKALK